MLSYFIWEAAVKQHKKDIIKVFYGQIAEPAFLPNTFWHHEFNPDSLEYRGIVNAKGTKGDDFTVPKPPGELRIICLGDSVVEGTQISPKDTFPGLLEEKLQPVIRQISQYKSVKVINAGISSHNSAFNLAYLEFRLIHYKPDMVIIKSSYNDYLPYVIPGMTFDYTHAFPKPFVLEFNDSYYWRIARYSYFLKICGLAVFRKK